MSDDPARRIDRRRALAALAGIAGLAAGCMGGDTDGPSQTATGTTAETASRTATATETRTEPGTATETATRTETETATRTETETATRTETETAAARCADTGIVVEGPDETIHCVAAVESDLSIEEYYGFDTETQNSSALVDGMEVTDATISFVYRNTATGDRSLVVVHDSPDGGTGGAAVMTFQGVDGTEWLVKDDPEPRSSSEAYEVPGETDNDSISAVWGWSGDTSLTDGGAIGPLDESFDITVTHHQEGTARETTSSRDRVDRWLFVDGADLDDPIELAEFTDENSGDKSIRVSTTDGGDGGDTAGDEDSSGDDTGGSDGDGETTDDGSTESGDDSGFGYGSTEEFTLEEGDGQDPAHDELAKPVPFEASAGDEVTITQASALHESGFDTYLVLEGPSGSVVAENDDGDGIGRNSRISMTLTESGEYTIWAGSVSGSDTGPFRLALKRGLYSETNSEEISVGQTLDLTLELGDGMDPDYSNLAKPVLFEASAGDEVTITQASDAFDTYLLLAGPSGSAVARNDDGDGIGTNSRISMTLDESGEYTIWAGSASGSEIGPFTLSLEQGM